MMLTKKLSLILIGSVLMIMMSGCNQTTGHQQTSSIVVPEQQANFIVFRPKQDAIKRNANFYLYVDDNYIGRLKSNSQFFLKLDEGEHRLWVNDSNKSELKFTVDSSRAQRVEGRYETKPKKQMVFTLEEGTLPSL